MNENLVTLLDEAIGVAGKIFGPTEIRESVFWPKDFPSPDDDDLDGDPAVQKKNKAMLADFKAELDGFDLVFNGDFDEDANSASEYQKKRPKHRDSVLWIRGELEGEDGKEIDFSAQMDESGDIEFNVGSKTFSGHNCGKAAAKYANSQLGEAIQEQGPEPQVHGSEQPSDQLARDEFFEVVSALLASISASTGADDEKAIEALDSATNELEAEGELPMFPDGENDHPSELILWMAAARNVDVVGRATALIGA